MKISELIEKLSKMKEKHGDLQVKLDVEFALEDDIDIELREDCLIIW